MKIYTRNGDQGETGLPGSKRVSKSHLVVEVCGSLDEANCHIGCAYSAWDGSPTNDGHADQPDPASAMIQVQNDLFDLGSLVALALAKDGGKSPVTFDENSVKRLEAWIDHFDAQLPPLRNFILPGGSAAGGHLHLARTVCRRAERRMVELLESEIQRDLSVELAFLNRLSDLLFVLARLVNQLSGCEETPWQA